MIRCSTDDLLSREIGCNEETAKRRIAEKVAKAEKEPLPRHGEVGNGRGRGDIVTSTIRGSNSQDYLIRRLVRDAPEIANAL